MKSLTLKGFKSFASATTLVFEPGICAVVGPNGSGKSNVVDALAWVMGEQGAKTLRGSTMGDVIFAGTTGRKPLGRAEVTLTIDNTDGALPIQYSEVSVTRRMFRDGASEYEINGSRCRLMDVQELLSDTGIGREMHIIVGQGRLSEILQSRPEDRRSYIEEAAGVLKHRRRKEKAQRKLASMQANLDRLEDLTGELSKQLKPLARQAEAAKRARTVQASLREAKLGLAAADLTDLRAAQHNAVADAADIARRTNAAAADADHAISRRDGLEQQLEQLTPDAEKAREVWFRLSALAERVSATTRIAGDRASAAGPAPWTGPDPDQLEAKADRVAAEEAELAEAEAGARKRLEEVRQKLASAEAAARAAEKEHLAAVRAIADRREGVVRVIAAEESTRQRLQAAEAEVTRLAEQVAESDERRVSAARAAEDAAAALAEAKTTGPELAAADERARTEAEAASARVKQLRGEERDLERAVSGLAARIDALQRMASEALTDGAGWLRSTHGLDPLSDLMSVSSGWDSAIAAALGPAADAVVAVDGADDLIDELVEAAAGRAMVLQTEQGTTWRLDAQLPAGCTWALDEIIAPPDLAAPLAALLVDVVLCPDSTTAREVVNNDNRLRAVTAQGRLHGPGWVAGGAGGSRSAVELGAEVAEIRAEHETASARLSDLGGVLSGAIAEEEDRRTDAAAARAALRDHQRHVSNLTDAVTRANAQRAGVDHDAARAAKRREEAEQRVRVLSDELDDITSRLARMDDEPSQGEPSTEERDRTAAELTAARGAETEARLALRTAEERHSGVLGKADRLRRTAATERQSRARHEAAQARRAHARDVAAAVSGLAKDLARRVDEQLQIAATHRDAAAATAKDVSEQLRLARQSAADATKALEVLRNKAHHGDIARAEAALRVQQAEESIAEQLGISAEDLLAEHGPGEDFDRSAAEAQLKQAEKDLRALGKVNPLALEEYAALEKRYSFLSTQLDDVQRARKDLLNVINDVDDTILQLFTDAWRDVEAEFPRVFTTLFPGGEGRLVLTDPDDMLTTGIEVEARPPGKRVKRLSLLSGGEKSLTALAMLVAIFRARPSPFYVLDEVEAALDDVNLRRLIALLEELRESSQLIVITHQKPTMDVANVLYGMTMQGDGVTKVLSQRMAPKAVGN
nr:chromosome segregation protein SMC [Corynebacterium sp. TAE3-ERU12]